MMTALVAGFLAGLGVAIPVGAAAVLIVDVAVRRGWRAAAAAGTGVAVGDGLFALLAAVFGGLAARLLTPWATALQLLGVVTLVVIAVTAIRAFPWSDPGADVGPLVNDLSSAEAASGSRTLGVFARATMLHPLTVIYFLALVLGLAPTGSTAAEKMLFAGGAFLASLGWQLGLAAFGASRRHEISWRARRALLVIDCMLLAGLIAYIGLGWYRA